MTSGGGRAFFQSDVGEVLPLSINTGNFVQRHAGEPTVRITSRENPMANHKPIFNMERSLNH